MGRGDEAVAEARRAEALDPLSLADSREVGAALFYSRKYDESIEQLKKTLLLDPNFVEAHTLLGRNYQAKKMYPEAVAEWQKMFAAIGDAPYATSFAPDPQFAATAGEIFRKSGYPAFLQAWFAQDLKNHPDDNFDIALLYASLGEDDQAITSLEKAYAARSPHMLFLRVDPVLDPIRANPRFQLLAQRMNFPQ